MSNQICNRNGVIRVNNQNENIMETITERKLTEVDVNPKPVVEDVAEKSWLPPAYEQQGEAPASEGEQVATGQQDTSESAQLAVDQQPTATDSEQKSD